MISGGRDLITPPTVAERVTSLIPNSVLVNLPTAGHGIVDLREGAALDIVEAIYDGRSRRWANVRPPWTRNPPGWGSGR